MAELRVTRADLQPPARTKSSSDITLSDVDRPAISAVRSIEVVTFVDDDGKTYPLKDQNGPTSAPAQPDYLQRKEDNTNTDDESREGVAGSDLQHRDTTGAGAPDTSELDLDESDEVEEPHKETLIERVEEAFGFGGHANAGVSDEQANNTDETLTDNAGAQSDPLAGAGEADTNVNETVGVESNPSPDNLTDAAVEQVIEEHDQNAAAQTQAEGADAEQPTS